MVVNLDDNSAITCGLRFNLKDLTHPSFDLKLIKDSLRVLGRSINYSSLKTRKIEKIPVSYIPYNRVSKIFCLFSI